MDVLSISTVKFTGVSGGTTQMNERRIWQVCAREIANLPFCHSNWPIIHQEEMYLAESSCYKM